ncbi:MAG: cell division protein SepF [Clostridia bacterium]|nr:cell division protein SepF [Clostridia bacterium]
MSAAIINKLMDMIGVGGGQEAEEYDENEEYSMENEEFEDENMEDVYKRPSSFKSRKSFSEIERDSQYSPRNMQTKVIPMNTGVSSSKMVITQPTCYDEVEGIGEYLKNRKSIIINLENVGKEDARRILDFLSGSTFMVEGTIQRVSNLIYLITPKNVEIQNDLERTQYKQQKMSFSWLK